MAAFTPHVVHRFFGFARVLIRESIIYSVQAIPSVFFHGSGDQSSHLGVFRASRGAKVPLAPATVLAYRSSHPIQSLLTLRLSLTISIDRRPSSPRYPLSALPIPATISRESIRRHDGLLREPGHRTRTGNSFPRDLLRLFSQEMAILPHGYEFPLVASYPGDGTPGVPPIFANG